MGTLAMQPVLANSLMTVQTMSSREISTLSGKEHRNVVRDFKTICEQLSIDVLKYERIYFDSLNRQQTEYLLDYELTMILITGYNVRLRAAVIRRWRELEQHNALPDFTDPPAAAMAWAGQYRLKQQAEQQLAVLIPKAEALDRITKTDDVFGIREAANALKIPQKILTNMLIERKWAFRTAKGKLQGYATRSKQGVITHVITQPRLDEEGVEHVYQQLKITSKGIAVLAEILEKEGAK